MYFTREQLNANPARPAPCRAAMFLSVDFDAGSAWTDARSVPDLSIATGQEIADNFIHHEAAGR